VRSSDLVSPVSSSNSNDGKLSKDDGSSDSSGNFLSTLNSKSNVSLSISNYYKSFESSSLTSSSLLLNRHDLHDFILQLSLLGEEFVDDFNLFDGKSEEIDFFDFLDVSFLD